MIEALGFDLDNTLYDQSQHLTSFAHEAGPWLAKRAGISARMAEETLLRVWKRRTMSYPHIFDEALQMLGIWRHDLVTDLVDNYRSHRPPLTLYEGVRPMLERLGGRLPIFLITNGNGRLQRYKVREMDLEACFRTIVYTDDLGAQWRKPAPSAFLLAARQLRLAPLSCLYVGDDPHRDVKGAQGVGMQAARVLTGPFQHRPCSPPPDLLLHHVTEVESAIGEQGGLPALPVSFRREPM